VTVPEPTIDETYEILQVGTVWLLWLGAVCACGCGCREREVCVLLLLLLA
jgi:hypothetical protein